MSVEQLAQYPVGTKVRVDYAPSTWWIVRSWEMTRLGVIYDLVSGNRIWFNVQESALMLVGSQASPASDLATE